MIQRSGGGDYPQEAADIMANEGYPPVDTMLTADPPRHTRYRSLVDKAFSPKRVTDMGPEIEDKIFDPFFTGKEVGQGRGMGLAAIKAIAEDFGGDVSFRRLQAGVEFSFVIPSSCNQPRQSA